MAHEVNLHISVLVTVPYRTRLATKCTNQLAILRSLVNFFSNNEVYIGSGVSWTTFTLP